MLLGFLAMPCYVDGQKRHNSYNYIFNSSSVAGVVLQTLKGMARYAGQFLARAKGSGQGRFFFGPSGEKGLIILF